MRARLQLDPEIVREVRKGREEALEWLSGQFREVLPNRHPYSIRSIARRLGISTSSAYALLHGRTW